MKLKKMMRQLVWGLFFAAMYLLSACTVITDFDESKLKTDLDDVLIAGNISLRTQDGVGILVLRFASAFSSKETVLLKQMFGDSLRIILADDSDMPDVVLTRNRLATTPAQPGDFRVSVGEGGKNASVYFFNPPIAHFPLVSGDTVTLILDVSENAIIDDGIFAYDIIVD